MVEIKPFVLYASDTEKLKYLMKFVDDQIKQSLVIRDEMKIKEVISTLTYPNS